MPAKRTSRIGRFFGFLIFKIVPAVLFVGMIWSGYQVAEGVARQMDERSDFMSRVNDFPVVATALVDLRTASAPTMTPVPPTETPLPTDTPVPTATDVPPTNTPSPTMTVVPPTDTLVPTATNTVEAEDRVVPGQFGATNTPRPVSFATNTPVSASGQSAEEAPSNDPTATDAPARDTLVPSTPTLVPTDPPALTETEAPPEALATTGPLPTLLAPLEPPEGLEIGGTAVPTRVPFVDRQYDLVNIVLLGSDDELSSDDFIRTDTIIIVSINRDTGSVSMLSLPRDLFVYIPTPSGAMQRINVAYGIGENIGYTDGGFGLLRQTIWHNLGINVHYYARVNFNGFQQIIDTLGGIDIAVDCAYQDYQLIGAEVPDGAVEFGDQGLRTLNIGYYQMNGAQALWYARTRRTSSDFDRGRRQQQILRAIWRKSLDTVSLTNAPQLWNQGMEVIETDMGVNDFISLLPLALNLDVSRIRSYTLVRTYHTTPWQTPTGDFVQLPVYETMRPLLEDFYRPPPESQLLIQGATISVYNGTENPDWDRVAVERLGWEGFRSVAMGEADESGGETILIDYTGQQRSSSLTELTRLLNVRPENIRIEPDPERAADFAVILGDDYNSCNVSGVLPVDQ